MSDASPSSSSSSLSSSIKSVTNCVHFARLLRAFLDDVGVRVSQFSDELLLAALRLLLAAPKAVLPLQRQLPALAKIFHLGFSYAQSIVSQISLSCQLGDCQHDDTSDLTVSMNV